MRTIADDLDGKEIGRFGFKKWNDGSHVRITAYDMANYGDAFDEKLTFTPAELIEFCRGVLKIAEGGA